MSNIVSIQFTSFQDLDMSGNPEGKPTMGYRIYDDYEQTYNNCFPSIREMKNAGLIESRVFDFISENHEEFEMTAREKGVLLNGRYISPPVRAES